MPRVKEPHDTLVTIQVTLGKDDIAYMQEVIETGEVGVGILEHIVEQYNIVKSKGEMK
jgi:hypothetical protein